MHYKVLLSSPSLVTIFTFVAVLYHLCHLRHLYICMYIYIYIFPATTTTTTTTTIFNYLPGDLSTGSNYDSEVRMGKREPWGTLWWKATESVSFFTQQFVGIFWESIQISKKSIELGCWFDYFGLAFILSNLRIMIQISWSDWTSNLTACFFLLERGRQILWTIW